MKSTVILFVVAFAAGAALASGSLERDVEFIRRYAPERDRQLPGAFVTNNCVLASVARDGAIERYPDEIYLDYVLPYTVIREEVDDWRAEFRERFLPLVEGCADNYEAAVKLDRTIWDMIGVHYSPKRDKARQSPRHSMRIGMASCTGISIILIDACRAVGIPARLVGCCWTTIAGNHSWVEVWSGGRWRVLASDEKEREDSIWFLEYAALADRTRIDRRIYASRYSPSPAGTRFWLTWDHPQRVSDVPADDVTARYAKRTRLAVVASKETLDMGEWREAAYALVAKHSDEADASIVCAKPTDSLAQLRESKPRYVAFLMRPDEFDNDVLVSLKQMMRRIDDDPYDDAIWGIVTGPDAATAKRIAASCKPDAVSSVLATTGVDADVVTGEVAVVSDAFPKGVWWRKGAAGSVVRGTVESDSSPVFASAWREIDPELLLTSSHATERNLEMPFSMGNIVVSGGAFARVPRVGALDGLEALCAPQREKVWVAAGNCLIANHLDGGDMVMTALSFGKVNQFVGYARKTWFGFAGWNTWRYFGRFGYPLNTSHYAACVWLQRRLETRDWKDERDKLGLAWDLDATVLYGDPMQRVYVPRDVPSDDDAPSLVVFPDSGDGHRIKSVLEGYSVFEADDFALVERTGK